MSNDSASEPPSSAVSYTTTFTDGYSSAASPATSLSHRLSMEFPFSNYPSFNILRGPGNTLWHPPMLPPQQNNGSSAAKGGAGCASPRFIHPPMLLPQMTPWISSIRQWYIRMKRAHSRRFCIRLWSYLRSCSFRNRVIRTSSSSSSSNIRSFIRPCYLAIRSIRVKLGDLIFMILPCMRAEGGRGTMFSWWC